MEQTDLYLLFTGPLDAGGIRYMATGSVASMVYGVPRLTEALATLLRNPALRTQMGQAAKQVRDRIYAQWQETIATVTDKTEA